MKQQRQPSLGSVILIAALVTMLFNSCSIPATDPENNEVDDVETIHLSICVLGNSYSCDSFSYLPFILKEYGITTNIHIYFRGNGSLHALSEQWYDSSQTSVADIDGGQRYRLHFSIDTRKEDKWIKDKLMSAHDMLMLEKWDIITLQQGGNRAKIPETYVPYLQDIINHIDSVCNYKYVRTWFMAYNNASENSKEGSCEASLSTQFDITHNYPFDLVLPVATAVFNCQQTETLAVLGDSRYKRMYAPDNEHLQEGLPCYVAALTIAEAILRKYKPECSVLGNQIRPKCSWIDLVHGILRDGESTGVNEYNCNLAQCIAFYSNDHMYEISY